VLLQQNYGGWKNNKTMVAGRNTKPSEHEEDHSVYPHLLFACLLHQFFCLQHQELWMITSIGAGKTNMAPCVFVWFLILKQSVIYLLSVTMMMPLQLFFLLWKICVSHQLLAL
jgi:hypothetical protein